MKTFIKTFDAWHKTKTGYAVMGVLELAVAYVLASRAIDTGSWWEYLFTLIFFIGAAQNFVKLAGSIFNKHYGKN